VTRLPRASRFRPIATVCCIAIVIIATLWTLGRRGETDSADGFSRKQQQSPGSHSAVLTWKASISAVAGYNVYRADNSVGPYKKLNPSPIREIGYKDSAVQSGHEYFYTVTSIDGLGHESGFSNLVRATIPSS